LGCPQRRSVRRNRARLTFRGPYGSATGRARSNRVDWPRRGTAQGTSPDASAETRRVRLRGANPEDGVELAPCAEQASDVFTSARVDDVEIEHYRWSTLQDRRGHPHHDEFHASPVEHRGSSPLLRTENRFRQLSGANRAHAPHAQRRPGTILGTVNLGARPWCAALAAARQSSPLEAKPPRATPDAAVLKRVAPRRASVVVSSSNRPTLPARCDRRQPRRRSSAIASRASMSR
jgi:hypothetical protein